MLDENITKYTETRVFIFEMMNTLRMSTPALWQFHKVFEAIALKAIESDFFDDATTDQFIAMLRKETLKYVTLALASDNEYELFVCLSEIDRTIKSWTDKFESKSPFFIDTKQGAKRAASEAKLN